MLVVHPRECALCRMSMWTVLKVVSGGEMKILYGFAFIGPTPNRPFYKRYYFFFGTIIDQPRHYFVTARSGPTVSGPIPAAGRLRPPSLPPAPFSGATTSVTTLAGSSDGSSSCRV